MRIIGKVEQEEMDERFPDLMEALTADPSTVSYCVYCDGLRTHSSDDCPNRDVEVSGLDPETALTEGALDEA